MNTYRILIADDHQMFLDGLKLVLSTAQEFEVVAEANNGREVLDMLSKTAVDMAILDINMPEMDGMETAKAIKAQFPQIRILMLSMHSHDSFIKRLLRTDVDGYILKENGQKELVTALQALASGQKYFAQDVQQAVMNSFNAKDPKSGLGEVHLTPRELEVLQLVAQEMTTQAIADKIFVSQSTVITHRKNIMQKLDVKNTAGMIRYAIEQGLLG